MKIYCHKCGFDVEVEIVNVFRVYNVREEYIAVNDKDTFCTLCGEMLFNRDIDLGILEKVNNIYRERHNLLFPDEIKRIREVSGLTQYEFSKVLGFKEDTIARYENGAIPSKINNDLIKNFIKKHS